MGQSLSDRFHVILKDLETSTPDIEATAIVSSDGLVIASRLPSDVEEDRIGAMSAAMLSLGERSSTELSRGTLNQVLIKGVNGYIVMMNIGEESVLVAMTNEKIKLGLLFLELRRTAEHLQNILG